MSSNELVSGQKFDLSFLVKYLNGPVPMTESVPLNLKRVHYFVVLAEELHFGRAAARLFIAQPGLSQQIKTLEAELGVHLVERGGRETRLTAAGELMYREATRLLRESQEAVERVQARADDRTSRLTVGYSRSTTYVATTSLVQEFRSLHPEIQVSTTVAWTALNIEMLRTHNADAVFVRPPVEEPDLEVLTLFNEEHVVALPPGHRLIDKPVLVPSDVAQEDVVLWPRKNGPGHYDRLVAQIWGQGHPHIVLEEPDDEQILVAVAEGLGIAVLETERARHLPHRGVTIRRFAEPVPMCDLGVAWRREGHAPSVETFIAFCRQRCVSARTA
jgi:DNA-binding transcriptional LysR family regulator